MSHLEYEQIITLWRGDEFVTVPLRSLELSRQLTNFQEEAWRKSGAFKSNIMALTKKAMLSIQKFETDQNDLKKKITRLENERLSLAKKGSSVTNTTAKIDALYEDLKYYAKEKNNFFLVAKKEIEELENKWEEFELDAIEKLKRIAFEEDALKQECISAIKRYMEDGYVPKYPTEELRDIIESELS